MLESNELDGYVQMDTAVLKDTESLASSSGSAADPDIWHFRVRGEAKTKNLCKPEPAAQQVS